MKLIKILIGKLRMLLGFCPCCNSSAPELYDCAVCNFYHGKFPPSSATKRLWWENYIKEPKTHLPTNKGKN